MLREQLISTIDTIIQFGLKSDLDSSNKRKLLEESLVKLYNFYFDIEYIFDEVDYTHFDKAESPNIRENIISNFPEFGLYKIVNDITQFNNIDEFLAGDAVDDLFDIIMDLLEVKWRIENNSLADGFWYFKFSFETHLKQHVLDLLNYMSQTNK